MSKGRPVVIDAGRIVTPLHTFAPGRLIIQNGTISEVGSIGNVPVAGSAAKMEFPGLTITPGFIDPHIHGCGGADVMEATYESLNVISRCVAKHGTTAFLPTTVSSPDAILTEALEKLGTLMNRQFDGAEPLGIHMEGPFINAVRRGTHKAANIVPPGLDLFRKWLRVSQRTVRLLTVAPELDGIDAIVSAAAEAGIALAMGHSNASLEEATAAADRGVRYAVHTFNAMRQFTHRDPGITGAVLADDRVFAEIIADHIHVSPEAILIFARAKGRERVVLATDAISATDMPDGRYMLGTDAVAVAGGVCRDAEGRLAGSTLTQEAAFRNFVSATGFAFEDALLGLTLNPARALKLERKGILQPGGDADLAVLDDNLQVRHTFVGGRLVWTSSR